jgi:hypothetical protein
MLETEIKKLNENIAHLNKLLEAMSDTAKGNAKTPEPTSTPEVEIEDAPGYTTDDIKAMALAISRKDRSKQKDIKAKLAEHDAKIATDLTGVALQEVGEWLSALKEEMGA